MKVDDSTKAAALKTSENNVKVSDYAFLKKNWHEGADLTKKATLVFFTVTAASLLVGAHYGFTAYLLGISVISGGAAVLSRWRAYDYEAKEKLAINASKA